MENLFIISCWSCVAFGAWVGFGLGLNVVRLDEERYIGFMLVLVSTRTKKDNIPLGFVVSSRSLSSSITELGQKLGLRC